VNGACRCGDIQVSLELIRELSAYSPRVCDCDFCRARDAAYVSDSEGSLSIWIDASGGIELARQGSMAAEFMLCRDCATLVAVRYESEGRWLAAANARILDYSQGLWAETSVSPKNLSPAQKIDRWKAAWFGRVAIHNGKL
jgi:hypothetical protein